MSAARCDRNRLAYLIAIVVVMFLGIASRAGDGFLPGIFGNYPGDVLWAAMGFFVWGALAPRSSTLTIALLTYAVGVAVEFLKLWKAPWLDDFRQTSLGQLMLGNVFAWTNLVAYAVGVALAAAVDLLWPFRRR